jgi:undecaprenyl-diphosphatase
MNRFFVTITWLGSLSVLLPLTALLILGWIRMGRWGDAALLGLSLALNVAAVHAIKLIFRRPRPEAVDLLVSMPADWSFPSAHTAQAAAVFLPLALLALRSLPRLWGWLCLLSALGLVGAVGYSRVYLQVHYTSDVLAGAALAVVLVAALQLLLPRLPWWGP